MAQQQQQRNPRERLLSKVPVEQRHLDIGGTTTAVLEGGEGAPFVLLHGGIQAGGVVWWRVLGELAGRHRVVVPDIPGFGDSEPVARLDAGTVSEWLAALVERTCAEAPTLVAHSAPAGLAARFAADHGDLLRRLVLVDSAGLAAFRPSPAFLAALLRSTLRPSPANAERFLRRVMADLDRTREDSGEQWKAFVAAVAERSGATEVKQAMRQLVRAGTRPLTDQEVAGLRVPTALVWGRRDPLFPLRVAEAASAARGWPLSVVDDAGHLPHVEQPDRFASALAGLTDGA